MEFLSFALDKCAKEDNRNRKSILMMLRVALKTEGVAEMMIDENENIVNSLFYSFRDTIESKEMIKYHLKVS